LTESCVTLLGIGLSALGLAALAKEYSFL